MLSSEVDWVIVEILSSATPLIPSVTTIWQIQDMSQWYLLMSQWKWVTLVSCVGFRKLNRLDLEGLVSADMTIFIGVSLLMSGSRSELRGVTNRVWFRRRDILDLEMLSCWQLDTLITCVVFLKAWRFWLVNAVFGGWMGDCQNVIFSNTNKTLCHNNLPGLGYDLVATAYLGQICWFSKTWWFRLGRLGFGYWLVEVQEQLVN